MVYSVIASPLGRLSELTTADAYQHNLPRLQFDEGDLVIKLGDEPDDWLVVHSRLFAAVSPVFAATWKVEAYERWATVPAIRHPGTTRSVAVRVLALTVIDGAYVLEDQDLSLHPSSRPPIPIHTETTRALRIFFSLIYGANLSLSKITAGGTFPLRILASVCAHAEVWECLETLRPTLTTAIMGDENDPQVWKNVAAEPKTHAILAKKLGIAEIYYDAIRHLAAQAFAADEQLRAVGYSTEQGGAATHWAELAEIMGLNEEEVLNIFPWQIGRLGPVRERYEPPVRLEGKGWEEWVTPRSARWPYPGYATLMAVPSRVPWVLGEVRERDWTDLRGEIGTGDVEEEWMTAVVELLERR